MQGWNVRRVAHAAALCGMLTLPGLGNSTLNAQATTWYLSTGLPGANTSSVWASSSNDVYIAGGFRGFGNFNGTSWSSAAHPNTANRYDVWGFGPQQAYSVGQNGYQTGAVHSCTATACTTIYTAETELTGIWGRSPSDLYVAGDGILRRYDGTSWTNIPTGFSSAFNVNRFESISGGATRTFVVGRNGVILSYDGTSLQQMSSGTTVALSSVFAVNDHLAFAVGGSGTILQFNGTSWSHMQSNTLNELSGVFALSATSAYATGSNGTVLYWNGSTWTPVNVGSSGQLGTPFALSESQVYIPRANGAFGELISSDATLNGRLLISSTVPEPGTYALVLVGIAAIFGVRRRNNALSS